MATIGTQENLRGIWMRAAERSRCPGNGMKPAIFIDMESRDVRRGRARICRVQYVEQATAVGVVATLGTDHAPTEIADPAECS